MEFLRFILQASGLAILVVGPAGILGAWWFRTARPPTWAKFTIVSVVVCTVAFWAVFLVSEHLLELQFRDIAPDGSWTPSDEAAWTAAERRVAETYFGDGGRNVFAVFVSVPLLLYSTVLWTVTRTLHAFARRRAV
jgi:hypothetical protein